MVILGHLLLGVALLYVAIGLAVGFRFAIVVSAGFNERAATGSFPFRMLLIPGAMLLWPIVLRWGSHGVGFHAAGALHGDAAVATDSRPASPSTSATNNSGNFGRWMNRDLRHVHWRLFRELRVIVPVILFVSILGYQLPVYSELPPGVLRDLPVSAEREHEEEGEFEGNVRLRVEIFRVADPSSPMAVEKWVRVTPAQILRQPDLLVYWSPKSSTYEEPPLGAIFLGVMDPRTSSAFVLPQSAQFLRGYLVIYSLGQRVLITQMQLPQPE